MLLILLNYEKLWYLSYIAKQNAETLFIKKLTSDLNIFVKETSNFEEKLTYFKIQFIFLQIEACEQIFFVAA